MMFDSSDIFSPRSMNTLSAKEAGRLLEYFKTSGYKYEIHFFFKYKKYIPQTVITSFAKLLWNLFTYSISRTRTRAKLY